MATVENERISGSVRCSDKYDAKAFLSTFSNFFDDYGGHRCAAGFSMPYENKDNLIEMMEAVILAMEEGFVASSEITVDAMIPPEYMTTGLWRLSSLLEPYGQENEILRLYLKDAVITDISPSKQDQRMMRFSLRYGTYAWPALWWEPHDRESFRKGSHVNVVFSPEVNYWKGSEKEQLLIVDMEVIDRD